MKILPKFDNEPNQYEIQVEVRDWKKVPIKFFWTCESLLDSGYPKYPEYFVHIMYI